MICPFKEFVMWVVVEDIGSDTGPQVTESRYINLKNGPQVT